MRLSTYLVESINKIPWQDNPKIGWWLDNDPITLYHGTHEKNMSFIKQNGIVAPKEGYTANIIYLAFEPYTAFGYAAMSGIGGESMFRSFGTKAKTTPPNERIVFIIQLPLDVVLKKGKINRDITDREAYENSKSDTSFYQLIQVSFFGDLDKKYIKGYMKQ